MMKMTALKTAVKSSISDILEMMFFLPIEFSDFEETEDLSEFVKDGSFVAVGLSFKGPFSGRFSLLVPSTLARSLTGSFLGEEEAGMEEVEISGTVKEILNMTAGKSFSVFDEQAVFQLGIPEVTASENVLAEFSEEKEERFALLIRTLDAAFILTMIINP